MKRRFGHVRLGKQLKIAITEYPIAKISSLNSFK
jgi:hypothetical protein